MSLRNALGLFFLGLITAASASFWYAKPREHLALIVTQFIAGIVMVTWAIWKAPKTWKPRHPSPRPHDNVAA